MDDQEHPSEMSPELAELVRDAVASDPSPQDLARLRARLATLGGASGGGTGTSPRPDGARLSILRGGAVIGLGVVGVLWFASSSPGAHAPEPLPRVEDLPVAPRDAVVATEAADPAPVHTPDAPSETFSEPRRRARPPSTRVGARPLVAAPTDDTVAEALLIEQARQALTASPARALALTVEHARRFARPTLRVEAEVLAIEALVRLGRDQEARARADALFRAEPRTAYRHRVERALAR